MEPFEFKTKKGTLIQLRSATRADLGALVRLNKLCYPVLAEENVVWKEPQLRNHLAVFPDGQIVAEKDGELVGAISSLIVNMGRDPLRPHTYSGITDGGYFHNHDREGDTLYGADVYVHPEFRSLGIGSALYEARRHLCRELNLRRILAGGRIWNYEEVAERMSPEEYVAKVEAGELRDLVLSFQLKEGFSVRGVLRSYLNDPKSRNCASLIEWLNPDYKPPETPAERKVRVACVQYQMRRVSSFDDFAAQVTYFTETAADYSSDFVMFPEFFTVQLLSHIEVLSPLESIRKLTAFTGQFVELMSGLAKKHGLHIIAGSHVVEENGRLYNKSFIFRPNGSHVTQAKLHITPSERREWGISGGDEVHVLETPKVKFGVQICYDIEFPETARYLADRGAEIIFVPYCTDNRQGHLRVRYCAQARAIENQIYVVTAGVTGNLPSVPAMDIHYGQAAVFTPSDFAFARDGIQAEADSNIETLLVTDLDISDLYRSRQSGSVTPRLDRRRDLFEIVTKLKDQPSEPGVETGKPLDLPD
jgi:predicted amidohydrolase/ribosomal protein S18 acetylase RimI-like enzyme